MLKILRWWYSQLRTIDLWVCERIILPRDQHGWVNTVIMMSVHPMPIFSFLHAKQWAKNASPSILLGIWELGMAFIKIVEEQYNIPSNNCSQFSAPLPISDQTNTMTMPSTSTKKSVSFSETSTLVVFPKCSATSMWYQHSDMESFKESFERSVVEIRYNLSRGDIRGSELLGMEKHLTQDVSCYVAESATTISIHLYNITFLTYDIRAVLFYSCSSQENTLYAEEHYRVQF